MSCYIWLPRQTGGIMVHSAMPADSRSGGLPRRRHDTIYLDRDHQGRLDGLPEKELDRVGRHEGGPARVHEVRQSGEVPEVGQVVERICLSSIPSPSI